MNAHSESSCWPPWLPDCSPEQRFLLALIGRSTPQRESEWRRLLPTLNWQQLLDQTQPQLYPYLHFCLQGKLSGISCPPDLLERLAGARRVTALHNLRLLAELRKIHALFSSADIPVVALKGIILAPMVYGDMSLRPMQDLDLLVPTERSDEAKHLLRKLGYATPDRITAKHPALHKRHPQTEYAPGMQKRGTRLLVEIHTQLEIAEPAFPNSLDAVWQRSVEVSLNGVPVRTLCPVDFLAHLCVHFSYAHDYSMGLLPLLDIMKFVERHQHWSIDSWEELRSQWYVSGFASYMLLTLSLAHDMLGAPIPATVRELSPALASLRETAWRQMWADKRASQAVPEGLIRVLAQRSFAARARAFINRIRPMYEFDLSSRSQRLQAFRVGLLRLLIGLRVQLPRYLRALRAGNLAPARLHRAVQLMRDRERMGASLDRDKSRAA